MEGICNGDRRWKGGGIQFSLDVGEEKQVQGKSEVKALLQKLEK